MGRHNSASRSPSARKRSKSRSRSSSRSSRSRSTSPFYVDGGTRVHVGDLGLNCSRKDIENNFNKFGEILEVWLARNPPCFAFLVFKHRDDAEDAVKGMDGGTVCGGKVRVSLARPRTRGMRRRRGFDPNLRCYQCGSRGHFSRDCTKFASYRPSFRRASPRSHSRSRSPPPMRRHQWSRQRSMSPREPRDRRSGSFHRDNRDNRGPRRSSGGGGDGRRGREDRGREDRYAADSRA